MSDLRCGTFAGRGSSPSIYWQAWIPDEPPRAVVVIAHGVSEHSDRYAHVAARLVAEGYAVYALDHRGHGRSEGPRALIDRLDDAVADLDTVIDLATADWPGRTIYLLGHSMGGCLSLRYATLHGDRLAGLMLSGPLAALEAAPAPVRAIAGVLSALVPRLPVFAIDAHAVSRDPEVVRAYVADPRVHHGRLPVRTVAELAGAVERFPDDVAGIRLPVLIMYGTADRLCPPEGAEMVASRIGSDDVTVKRYEDLFHEILNEPERDRVLDDLCAWLGARIPAAARPA